MNLYKSIFKFGLINEVNANLENISTIQLSHNTAMGINGKNELIEWKCSGKINKKDFSFFLTQPIYHFYKMKFLKILVNSSVCLALESKIDSL